LVVAPGRKIKPPREFFRGGNFFVRANDVSGFFGEHGGNHLDGFHFHFSRVLPLASSRFFLGSGFEFVRRFRWFCTWFFQDTG
jgi:hypothetical protein